MADARLLEATANVGVQLGRAVERRRDEQSQAHLASIIDSSYDANIGKSLDGIITSWNAAAERMYGFTASEAIGRSISLIIPDDRKPDWISSWNTSAAANR